MKKMSVYETLLLCLLSNILGVYAFLMFFNRSLIVLYTDVLNH